MLTRRTNVLFSEDDYGALTAMVNKKKKTLGELIREAVREYYKFGKKNNSSVDNVLKNAHRLAKKINTRGISYRKMIDYGRKY